MKDINTDSPEIYAHIQRLHQLIYGNWTTCVTTVFAELGIADILGERDASLDALAGATNTVAGALKRFLRCATALGLIEKLPEQDVYRLAAMGDLLREDHPKSMKATARLNGADYRYQPWGSLATFLQTGDSAAISQSHGQHGGSLKYLEDKPEQLDVFHTAMSELSKGQELIVKAYDFSRFRHVVDVAGGQGSFLRSILDRYPNVCGTLFDLPQTFESGEDRERDERIQCVSGDFFQSLPPVGDLYLLKNVVHNWPDSETRRLMVNVRTAMLDRSAIETRPEDKRLLIIEYVISDESPGIADWLDLNFAVLTGGRERTMAEYRELAEETGFVITNSLPTAIGRTILELKPCPSV